jgi:hypothetical protein
MTKEKSDILETAKKRFEIALENDDHNRERYKMDIRFAAASPDDPWQWEDADVASRKLHKRPMLTINKLPQHIRQVTNDVRQNRPSIRYRPADSNADVEVAEILMGLARHIEANSDADIAYDFASENQVTYGLGYIRVVSDYISEDSFNQDIFIRPIADSLKCYDDPEAKDPAGADRKWFLIEDSLTKEDFEEQYPKAEAIDWKSNSAGDWFANDHVRIVEYFEITYKDKDLYLWANGESSFEGEPMPQGVIKGEKPEKTRKSRQCVVMWYKLNGQEILEEREFPSKYIPIARVLGNSWVVDGKTYYSGIVRNAKDSQRMYNVAQSAIVERVMLTPRAPYVGSIEAIEGYESVWKTANTENHAILPFNALDSEGNQLSAPQRVQPAQVETGLAQIAASSAEDIKSETAQYDASLGQKSNETSGRAIMARQREGDTATYHYVDNLARAVRHIGRIILDMIPKVYDSRRVARILGEDGSPANATIDTEHGEALTEVRDENGALTRIFNPTIGSYDVHTTTGPSFNTKRVEAVEAMTAMTQANPSLWGVIGDQLVKNMDWPGAEEMAERLKLTLIPPVQAMLNKDEGEPEVPPQMQQAMEQMKQQIQQMGQALENADVQVTQLETELDQTKKSKAGDAQAKIVEAENTAALAREKMEIDAAIRREQIDVDADLSIYRANKEAETKQKIAYMTAPEQEKAEVPEPEIDIETGEPIVKVDPLHQLLEAVVVSNQQLAQAVAQSNTPKTASIQIKKQPDGSFVGQKVEE